MIHLLILIALGLATYLFHNYQTFDDRYMRPWVVENVNFNREANPQALCDLLDPEATVIINDRYTQYSYKFTGGKTQACEYFIESASHFQKPQREKNGYIPDRLTSFIVYHDDLFKDYADVTFESKITYPPFGLTTVKDGEQLIGNTSTRITVKTPIFKEPRITHYEFTRKLVQPDIQQP
jgi:hypothetical protein